MSLFARYLRHPNTVPFRRVVFQIHLWSGLALGLYLVVVSLTGSVLVYRTELRQWFDPQPRVVSISGPRLTMDELVSMAGEAYPQYAVSVWTEPPDPTQAVTLSLERNGTRSQFFFDPYTGEDLGHALPFGWRATTWLLDLHDNLLSGETGRMVNGLGAIAFTLISLTGVIIWWPGIARWRQGLIIDRRSTGRRLIWSLHSAVGFWTLAFLLMWGITGVYLAFPGPFTAVADYLEPLDLETFEPRVGDTVLYWLAYLHFGRFGGSLTKVLWAFVGLVPPLMFITGGIMWWQRSGGRRVRER